MCHGSIPPGLKCSSVVLGFKFPIHKKVKFALSITWGVILQCSTALGMVKAH